MTMTIARTKLYILALLLLCSSLYAQPKEDKFGNKYYYQKVNKKAEEVRVLFVSDPHGNTYKTSNVIGFKKSVEELNPDDLTILLWGGDEPKGHPIWGFRKNDIGYTIWANNADAAVIGNHDLIHYPLDNIDKLIRDKGLKFIGTNVIKVDRKKQKSYPYPRYKIIELADGKKILILGLVTQSINTDDRISDKLYMGTPSTEYNQIIKQVESIHGPVESIFLLAHFERRLSPEKGEDLETFVKKIEKRNLTVFKGHDHKSENYFLKGNGFLVSVIETGEALNVIKYATFSAEELTYRGHLDVDIKDTPRDPATTSLINRMKGNIPIPLQYETLSETLFDGSDYAWEFNRSEIDERPENPSEMQLNNPLTALILDSYRYVVNSNIGMLESGNVRSGISRKKNITGMDIYKTIPFENDIVKSAVRGSDLEDLIDANYKSGEQRLLARGLIQGYDPVKNRLVIKKVYNPVTAQFDAFNPDAVYTVASIDHFAKKHELSMVDDRTGWKDYAAVIGYIKSKNKAMHNQFWVDKYQTDNYYCCINRNGTINSTEVTGDGIFIRSVREGEVYYKNYNRLSVQELIAELDLVMPDLKKLNSGYMFGLSPDQDPKDAAELTSSASTMYNVWANIYPHQRYLNLMLDHYKGDEGLAYHAWMTKLRGFILISRLFKELYPEDPRTATVWSSYTDLRLKSVNRTKTKGDKEKSYTESTKSTLLEHQDIKDRGKKIIREMLQDVSNGAQKLPAQLQELMTDYNNKLIEITKKLYDEQGVRYYTATVYTSYGKYSAIFYDSKGDTYLNRLAKFRSRFGTRLAYLPVLFLITNAGAQYDSDVDKNIFYVSENVAKGIKDYKTVIHEDMHILFRSMWLMGKESDLNGNIVRTLSKKQLEQDLYLNSVSLDEVAAYIESISYEVRRTNRALAAGDVVEAKLGLANAKQHTNTVMNIISSIKKDLISIYNNMQMAYVYSDVKNQYYDSSFKFENGELTVRCKKVNGLKGDYTELFYEYKGFVFTTMTEVLQPNFEVIRDKILKQIDLMEKFDALFYDFNREMRTDLYYIEKGISSDLTSESSMLRYSMKLLGKEINEIRSFYRSNIGLEEGFSFADVISAYDYTQKPEEVQTFSSFEEMTQKFNEEKVIWDSRYREMKMNELVDALRPMLPGLMGEAGYLPGLDPGTPTDAETISKDPSILYNVQGNIGGGPFAWAGNWSHYIEKYEGDLNKTYESVMNIYKAYSIMNIMLEYHQQNSELTKFLEASLPVASSDYKKRIQIDEHKTASKMYDNYQQKRTSTSNSIMLGNTDVVEMVSLRTGSSSRDISTQLDLLMQIWADNNGTFNESDKALLFGKDETQKGIYDYIYRSVMDGTAEDIEASRFFLIFAGALSYHNNGTTNQKFKLVRADIRLISTAYMDLGVVDIAGDVYINDKLSTKTWAVEKPGLIKFYNEGFDALVKYNNNYRMK